jgi:CHAD domain-containing protein
LRRLSSAIQAFAPVLEDERPLKRALRRLMPALGTARDWDVFVQMLDKPGLAPQVLRAARSGRNAVRRAAIACVASDEFRAFLFRSLRWLQLEPWLQVDATLASFAPQRLDKLHRRALRRVDFERTKRRHELRIRIKRLRYACEFFAPCFPQDSVEPYVKALRALQDILGQLNDIAVARSLLHEMGVVAPDRLARREPNLIGKLRAAWESFERQAPYWRLPA